MATIADQIAEYLEDNSIGTIGESKTSTNVGIYVSQLPDLPNKAVGILATGGFQSSTHEPTKSLTFQIMVRHDNYEDGMNLANTIRDLLHVNDDTQKVDYSFQTGQIHVLTGRAIQEPYLLEIDQSKRVIIVSNYNFLTNEPN